MKRRSDASRPVPYRPVIETFDGETLQAALGKLEPAQTQIIEQQSKHLLGLGRNVGRMLALEVLACLGVLIEESRIEAYREL